MAAAGLKSRLKLAATGENPREESRQDGEAGCSMGEKLRGSCHEHPTFPCHSLEELVVVPRRPA